MEIWVAVWLAVMVAALAVGAVVLHQAGRRLRVTVGSVGSVGMETDARSSR